MAAVIAAIGAAFLAGAVALFREHRLQQRQLLVAARVVYATFGSAMGGIATSLKSDNWAAFNGLPGEASFSAAWEAHQEDLAGHLTWEEWNSVESAVDLYLAVVRRFDREKTPKEAETLLNKRLSALKEGRSVLRPYCTHRLSAWRLLQRRLSGFRGPPI